MASSGLREYRPPPRRGQARTMIPPGPKPARASLDKRTLLGEHPIFGVLGGEMLDRLSAYAVRQTVKRGTTIFNKGDSGTSLFAVLSGTVKITAQSPGGREALFNLISEGAIFGEIALLDGRPRTADATAITDCELMVIEGRDFEALVYERPEIAFKLFEVLSSAFRGKAPTSSCAFGKRTIGFCSSTGASRCSPRRRSPSSRRRCRMMSRRREAGFFARSPTCRRWVKAPRAGQARPEPAKELRPCYLFRV